MFKKYPLQAKKGVNVGYQKKKKNENLQLWKKLLEKILKTIIK